MCRRIDRQALSACIVLLTIGTSSFAEELLFIDLSAAPEDAAFVPAESDSVVVRADSAVAVETEFSDEAVLVAADEPTVLEEVPGTLPEGGPEEQVVEDGFPFWRRPVPNYPLPSRSFSLFQSPASYGWDYFERCCPKPFQPRGKGIPHRTSCFRMDYRPYTLQHTESVHGPALYQRFELYPCEECHLHRKHLQQYYGHR